MTTIGRNMKWTVDQALREKVRAFFVDALGATVAPGPPHIDLYRIDGCQFGIFPVEAKDALRPDELRKAPWLEFLVDDVEATIVKLGALGVEEVEYTDREHRYFQAPGGPVFRLAKTG